MTDSKSIALITINYKSLDDVCTYVESISQLDKKEELLVVIADNTGCFRSEESRARLSKNVAWQIIDCGENLGYFGGARHAFSVFTESARLPAWTIVSNADVELRDKDFIPQLLNYPPDSDIGVIAPAILSQITGRDQNPHMEQRPSPAKINFIRWIFSSYPKVVAYHALWYALSYSKKTLLFFGSIAFPRRRRNETSSAGQQSQDIYAPHGSFIILSRSYFARGGSLQYPSFLFGEECFVAESARARALRTVYDPSFVVHHREHATTGRIPSRQMARYMKDSSEYLMTLFHSESEMAPKNPNSNVINMSVINMVGNSVRVGTSFITAVFASRWLGAEGYGLFNMIFGYTAFLNYLLTFGFDSSLTYYITRHEQEGQPHLSWATLKFSFSLSLLLGLGVVISLFIFLPKFLLGRPQGGVFLAAILMVLQALFWAIGSILSGFLRGHKIFLPTIVREQIVFPVFHLVFLALAVPVLNLGVTGYAFGYAGAALLSTGLVAFYTVRLLNTYPRLTSEQRKVARDSWYSWLRFSLPVGLTVTLEPLLMWSAIIAAGWYANATEIGHLAVANRLTIFVQFLFIAVTPIFTPYLAGYINDQEALKTQYQKVIFWCTKWALLFAFVLLTAGDYVLKLFGSEYSEALLSLVLIMPGSVAEACFGIAKHGLVFAGKNRINVINQIVGLGIAFGGSILLTPRYGGPGTAVAMSMAMLWVNLFRVIIFYSLFRIPPLSRAYVRSVFFASAPLVLLCLMTYKLELRGSQRLIAAIVAFVVGFVVSFWSERERAISFLNRRFGHN